jgi:guanylate kinase
MEVIERRMSMAEKRIKECEFYDYVVVNDDIDEVVPQVKAIILAARSEKRNLCGLNEVVEQILKDK